MTVGSPAFRALALCAAPALDRAGGERLRACVAEVRDWEALAADAEAHGVEPLLLTHASQHGVRLPPAFETRLKVRFMQHAHAAAVRERAIAMVLATFEHQAIDALILKGAALAHLVYRSPVLRPMRDLDVLVAGRDADRAWHSLRRAGFAPVGVHPGPLHHHLHALGITIEGETLVVEVHTQVTAAAPFVRAQRYEDVAAGAQTFSCGPTPARTLGREDMLWHIYAHAFLVNVMQHDTRLISIADLVAAVEAWADAIDWDRLRRRHPRLVRALPLLAEIVPWSSRVDRWLDASARRVPTRRRQADPWFDLRYGGDAAARRLWSHVVVHPVSVALAASHMARLKLRAYGHTP